MRCVVLSLVMGVAAGLVVRSGRVLPRGRVLMQMTPGVGQNAEAGVAAAVTPEPEKVDAGKEETEAKKALVDLMTNVGDSFGKRSEVSELVLRLEKLSPTAEPAQSPLLNGVWKIVYTSGKSPGLLGIQVLSNLASRSNDVLDIGDITICISRTQPRVEASASLKVLNYEQKFTLKSMLEDVSDIRLREIYEEGQTGSISIPLPEPLQYERTLFISYLDDDLMISRGMDGSTDILVRKEKEFVSGSAGVPSTSDDDLSPGSG